MWTLAAFRARVPAMIKLRDVLAIVFVVALGAACGGTQEPVSQPAAASPAPAAATADVTPPAAAPTPPTLRLGDIATPTAYAVHLTLDPEADTFSGEITISMTVARATDHLWLSGVDLSVAGATIESAGTKVAATPIDGGHDFIGFTFPQAIGPGDATLKVTYTGKAIANEDSGLFRQQQDGHWYLYSQFEATDARRAFPCFDEPSYKVPWTVTLTVPADDVAVTNTPPASQTSDAAAKTKTIVFAATKPLPSYLIALAVGPFDVVDAGTVGREKVPFRVVVPTGHSGEVAYAKTNTPTFVSLLEDYFDMPYPYPKLDVIAIPHFFGAMENPGAITFASSLMVRKPADVTTDFKQTYAYVATHELAHQWFGDLVTLAWWNDTWLNESFADWLSTKVLRAWKPEWNGEVSAVAARNRAKNADSLVSARQIRQPIKTADDIANIFDAISYAKGRSVLDMFERYVGEDKFQAGVRAYMHAHAWKTATADDFLTALSTASRPELATAFSTFLNQPGVPVLSVKLSCERGAKPSLAVHQQRFLPKGSTGSAAEVWSVPVCVEYGSGRKSAHQCTLLTEADQNIELADAGTCPDWVLANDDAVGYYRVAYEPALLHKLLRRARKLSTAEALGVISDLRALVQTGTMSVADGLAIVPTLMKARDPYITREAVRLVAGINGDLIPDALHKNYERFVHKLFAKKARKLGWTPKKGEATATAELRQALVPFVANHGNDARLVKQAKKLAAGWLANRKGVAPDLVGAVLALAAKSGDKTLYDTYYKQAKAEKNQRDRQILLSGMTAFRDKALLENNFKLFLAGEFELHDSFALLRVSGDWKEGRQLVWDFLKTHYDEVVEKIPSFIRSKIVYSATAFCDETHRADAAAFFTDRVKDLPGGTRDLAQALEQIQLCVAFRKSQSPNVAAFLKKQ